MERDRALEEIRKKKRAGEEGGEMLNRSGGGWRAERESKRYWHGRNWGKRGFTFHLNGMMSSARRQGDGTARAPEALRWSCVQHKYFAISNPSIQGDTLIMCFVFFPRSVLSLSGSRCYNCFAYAPAHGWYMESARAAEDALGAPLFVCCRTRVFVCSSLRAALIKRQLLIVIARLL